MVFCDWLLPLSVRFSRFFCDVACISVSLLSYCPKHGVCLHHIPCTHLPVYDIWVCPPFGYFVNAAAANICVHTFVWTYVLTSLGCVPGGGIAGSQGNSAFEGLPDRLPKWQNIFHSFLFKRFFFLFKRFYFLFTFREGGREEEREGNINQLPLAHPQPGTWPTTQARALTGN